MNLTGVISWAWRALRGHSVVAAVLCACALIGFSGTYALRQSLRALGLGWFTAFIGAAVVLTVLARYERTWWPDELRRQRWARAIVVAGLTIAVAMRLLAPEVDQPADEARDSNPPASQQITRPTPSGK